MSSDPCHTGGRRVRASLSVEWSFTRARSPGPATTDGQEATDVKNARLSWRFERWLGQTRPMRALIRYGDKGRLWWVPPLPGFVLKRWGTEPVRGPRSLA